MASEVTTPSAASEPQRLAELLGIGDDDPLRYLSLSSDLNSYTEVLNLSQYMSKTSEAQFCAQYLPRLVRAMREAASLAFRVAATRVLSVLSHQSLLTGHFLRTSPEAKDLLSIVMATFVQFGPSFLPQRNHTLYIVMLHSMCSTIDAIINGALLHGSVSTASLELPASLGNLFFSTCKAHLLKFTFEHEAATGVFRVIIDRLRGLLQRLPMVLGIEGAGEVVETRSVREISDSKGTLICELSEERLDEDGLLLGWSCGDGSGKKEKLKFCSICKSVAYCSPEHQRADWKKHKKVCFAPSW